MSVSRFAFVSLAAAAALCAGSAFAAPYGMDNKAPSGTPELPQCAQPIGTVAIQEPERDWWTALGLSNPEALLKLFAGRSNCLRVVARGEALQMRNQERSLGDSGEFQRGQNFGKGQVVAADYIIIPDIVDQNANSGGGGAALGGLLGSRFGGFAGIGGGYSNTDIGKVVSAAYLNAFVDLIGHMQGVAPGTAQAAAPIQAYTVTEPTMFRAHPSPSAASVHALKSGDLVYPTGQKNGVWWEVDDENGNRGWVSSAHISPRG